MEKLFKKIEPSKWNKIVKNLWKYNSVNGYWIIGEQSKMSSFPNKFLVRWMDDKKQSANEKLFDTFNSACKYILIKEKNA